MERVKERPKNPQRITVCAKVVMVIMKVMMRMAVDRM